MRTARYGVVSAILVLSVFWSIPSFAGEHLLLQGSHMSLWWVLPFAGLLLSIATGPMLFPRLWEHHFGKFALFWALAVIIPLVFRAGIPITVTATLDTLLLEYLPFIILLFALFTIAGGLFIEGSFRATPVTNTGMLLFGTIIASFVGTTGAAMIMIRPLIRANRHRHHNVHVIVFFIFLVCNIGGSLTPLGDPPLFVGFLRGVDFFWTTTHLFAEAATVAGILLGLFFIIDQVLYRKEPPRDHTIPETKISFHGLINIPLLGGVIIAILLSAWWQPHIHYSFFGVSIELQNLARDSIMIVMAVLSLWLSQKEHRQSNDFSWGPIVEVGKLFAAIFICLVPVAAILQAGMDGALAPLVKLVTQPDGTPNNSMYFWLTGLLSSVLDNTPTYLVFFDLTGSHAQTLMHTGAATLTAISSGAVFMGANTYIGNAPNFMVYAMARDQGIRMPHFFKYMLWSGAILIPVFIATDWFFFVS